MAFKLHLPGLGNLFGRRTMQEQAFDDTIEALGDASLLHHQIPVDQEYMAQKAQQKKAAGYTR